VALNIETLEESFDLIAPHGNALVDVFYQRLFETAPSTQALFVRADMSRPKQALLATLITLRTSLRNLDSILPALEKLGARHFDYGATPEHYPVVGQVLLASMQEIAGPAWKPAYTTAWTEAAKRCKTSC